MLIALDQGDRADAAPVLREMFAARKEVFVDLLGWDLPVLAGRYELDQFDDEHARYLIVADGAGSHLASARLLPTTRPHLLDTLFADLCAGPVPTGPSTFEITRFCLGRRLGAAPRRQARDELVAALADYALAHDITTYTGVAEVGWLRQILAFGWDGRALGPPRRLGGMTLGALRIDIGADTPARLARAGIGARWREAA